MDPVDGLGLHGGVPPGVQEEDVVGRMEGDPGPGRLERHEHDRGALGLLEGLHGLHAIERHARQFVAGKIRELLREGRADPVEKHHELGEDDNLVAAADHLGQFLQEQVELARVAEGRVEPRQHVRVAAGLPQAGEQREEPEGLLAHRGPDVVPEALQALRADPGVFGALDVGQGADEVHLHLGRQFLGDLGLRATEDEGGELGA